MLSDEEKKAINNLNFIIVTDIYDNEVSIDKTKIINEYNESVGIVLNLIRKQSKEIEELKEESKEYQIGFAQGCYEKDLDWEDKIKAKIEELDYNDIGNFERRCKQEVLQSLLEEKE